MRVCRGSNSRSPHFIGITSRVIFDGVKARTGRSPYSLVIEKRMRRAQELLQTSEDTIADIAVACGFCSQQHLTAPSHANLASRRSSCA